MPGEDSSGISSALVLAMGAGQRAAYGQGSRMRTCRNHARMGAGKVASRLGGGCQDLEDHSAHRVCHAGWQLSNRRWAVYLPQQCNLGTPSRSAHGPTRNYSACRQTSHGYLRQRVCAHSYGTKTLIQNRWQLRSDESATKTLADPSAGRRDMRSEVEAGARTINEHRNEQNQMPKQD